MDYIQETKKTAIKGEYDVIVVGGGIAGTAAALASARNGSKVLLLEKTTVLGGLATAGLVVFYLPLCDGMGHKVMGGIPEELLHASIKYGYNDLPGEWQGGPLEVDTKKRYKTVFNAPAFEIALDEVIKEAGIDLLLDTVFCDVVMEGSNCTAVIIENKAGRQAFRCKAVVDASGDADVFYRAGAECIEQDNHITCWAYCQRGDNDRINKSGSFPPGYVKLFTIGNFSGSDLPPGLPQYRGTNDHDVTNFLVRGREMALDMMKKDPDLVFSSFPAQAQFRTTRRLKGDHTLRTEDAGKHFADSTGCATIWNVPEPVYEIPLGSLCTARIKNIFAAGRIISAANGHAWEIVRPIPVCALTGQAAGSAAALLAKAGSVQIDELQSVLRKAGVMITMDEKLTSQSKLWLEKWVKSGDQWFKDKEDGPIYQISR